VDPVPTVLGEIGELAKQADILAVPIPGYWLYRTDTEAGKGVVELAKDGEKVLYTMHGGGYMVSSAHPGMSFFPYNVCPVTDLVEPQMIPVQLLGRTFCAV